MPITLNGTTGITSPDVDSSLNGLAYPDASSMGFRNRIINGDMRIDQRNNGASITPTNGQYALDRWLCYASAASKYTVQQNAGSVTPPTGFTNYFGVTSSSAYSVGAGDVFGIEQRIEGFNVSDLAFGTAAAASVTLSFWVRSSLTGTFGGVLRNQGNTRSYPFTFTISAANTWEQKTVTIPGDTSGTWAMGNLAGFRLTFNLGTGSTFSGTAGSWSGSEFYSATGAVSVVGTNGATFFITGVQLEAGSVATPFERRPFGTELALCQRYYGATEIIGYAAGSSLVYGSAYFPVTMRAAPTVVRTGNGGQTSATAGTTVSTAAVQYLLVFNSSIAAGGTYTLSAEL